MLTNMLKGKNAQRRNVMDGILIINKEKNYTSNDVVRKAKKILNCSKVGHTGTLDPNATGVLPLLLGNATKISKYIINHNKEYEAILQLGKKTSTADGEGEIIEEAEVIQELLNLDRVEETLRSFRGKLSQVPPIYSAIKVNGKKLYQYARNGQQVEIAPRKIEIFDINLIEINKEEKQISFYVKCSKGTYIRTLCEDIATKLGTIGYMKELTRLSVGEFNIGNAITIADLEKQTSLENFNSIITIEDFFISLPKVGILKENEWKRYLNGVPIKKENLIDGVYRVYYNDKFTGIGVAKEGRIKRDIVL